MRSIAIACVAFVGAAHAQTPVLQMVAADFDGDGEDDKAEVVTTSHGCALQLTLSQRPGETRTLAEGALCAEPIDILKPGPYKIRNLDREGTLTFRHPALAGPRRPGVRSVTYWDGQRMMSTWVVEEAPKAVAGTGDAP